MVQDNPDSLSYFEYYSRGIQAKRNGLKLVLGGTGLGKTSGIIDVIQNSDTDGRKFIYCANRLQLLEEMAEKLDRSGIPYAYQRSDADALLEMFRNPHARDAFNDLIEDNQFRHEVERYNKVSSWRQLDMARFKRAWDTIKSVDPTSGYVQRKILDQLLWDEARTIMYFFRQLLIELQKRDVQTYNQLIEIPVIQELFPYIRFKLDDQVPVLLITIQKAFLGFFDGEKTINLMSLRGRNGNNIIFLDEYDFLENELISLICRAEQIIQPFNFVRFFYEAMANHKLPYPEYPALPDDSSDLRDRLEKIYEIVESLRGEGIRFPDINQFTTKLDEKKGFIFQTRRTLLTGSLYLKQTERSYEIVREREGNLPVLKLFGAIQNATVQILLLFKELESQAPNIYRELLRQCFEDTDYRHIIGRIRQLPRKHKLQNNRFDELLEQGYGFYEIQELQQETDPDEVEFRYFTIYSTPEKIMSSLAQNNLVFGLSATADIPRLVQNFNMSWLESQDGLEVFDVSEAEIAVIEQLNRNKQQARDNEVKVLEAKTLDDYHREDIITFIEAIARDGEFGADDPLGYRRGRVEQFFSTLLWIIENRDQETMATDTHLLFFNSFAQIKYIFDKRERLNGQLFDIEPKYDDPLFDVYEMDFADHLFIVIFYNAAQAKNIRTSNEVQYQYNNLFWEGKPVICVTQYSSAGNGVNLQYYPTPQHKYNDVEQDFLNIHLLDTPYFYFGNVDMDKTIDENTATVKQNLWYLAKLYEGSLISRMEFEAALRRIRFENLNSKYHSEWVTKDGDAIYNRIAALIQAIGRIERVWTPMPDQIIMMNREVWNLFAVFCTRPQFQDVLERRMPIISSNLQAIFKQIREQVPTKEKWIRRYKEEGLENKNERSKEKIAELLEQLKRFRRTGSPIEAKSDWIMLREAILQHDYNNSILKKYACLFKAEYSHFRRGILYINSQLELLPHQAIFGDDVKRWDMNSVYWVIQQNPIMRDTFESRNYELGFNFVSQRFFTPYVFQSVLMGAIGEVAIHAVLHSARIPIADDLPDALFELADLKFRNYAWYLDCKNYSDRTLDNFHVQPDDPGWRPKLNEQDLKIVAQYKLEKIYEFHGEYEDVKLMYLNLTSSEDWRRIYFDRNFKEVRSLADAEIVIIPGIVQRDNPSEYTSQFVRFIDGLKKYLK